MSRKRIFSSLAAALPLLATLACVETPPPGSVYVDVAPPPVRVDVTGIAPSPHHVFVAGHWRYGYNGYTWAPGSWAVAPRSYSRWVDGQWVRYGGRYYWREGYWR